MKWKSHAAVLVVGIALGVWLGRATIDGPKGPTPPAAEVGRPIPGDSPAPVVPTELLVAIPKPDPARTARLAEKYGEAFRGLVATTGTHSQPTPQDDAGATISENPNHGPDSPVEPPQVAVFPLELAEKRVGPGPLGDEADVLALLPCPGCPVELLARWLDRPVKREPLFKFERQFFIEGGVGMTESGYGALVGAGYDFARISKATVGLRGTAILGPEPAGSVVVTVRWEP